MARMSSLPGSWAIRPLSSSLLSSRVLSSFTRCAPSRSSSTSSSSPVFYSRLSLLLLAITALLASLCVLPSARAASALYFDEPDALVQAIDTLGGSYGEVPTGLFSAALFGVSLYEEMLEGYLVYAGNGNFTSQGGLPPINALYGCGTFDVSSNKAWQTLAQDPSVQNIILLVERNPVLNSGCTFSLKVYSAQQATGGKVRAVLVADADDNTIVLMKDDDVGRQVYISSMFIAMDLYHAILQNWNFADPYDVYLEMEYYLPNPDGRVEMDMLYSILDYATIPWLTSFGSAARVLQYRLLSTPHWWVFEGSSGICRVPTAQQCIANCISTGSRFYCQRQADTGLLSGVNGSFALQEVSRQQCLYNYLIGLPASDSVGKNYPDPQAYWMWSYWELFYANCAYPNVTATLRFTAQCSLAQMAALSRLPGAPQIDTVVSLPSCFTSVLAPNATGFLPVFDNNSAAWVQFNPPQKSVQVFINLTPYYGDVQCRLPITETACGPLSAICYGYALVNGTQPYPVPCSWDNQCTFGVQNCTGITAVTSSTSSSGVSAGAVVGIIIAFLVILVAGLYYWYRRQQQTLKDDVDALLKQYLPMDPGATHGVAQGNHKTREQQERRLIQDMDLEDQDLEIREDGI